MLVFLLLVTKGSEPPWIGIGSIYLFLWGLNIHYRYLDTCSTPIPCPHSSEKYKEGKEPDRRLLLLCNCNREISMREQLIPKWNFQHSCISISSQTTEEGKKNQAAVLLQRIVIIVLCPNRLPPHLRYFPLSLNHFHNESPVHHTVRWQLCLFFFFCNIMKRCVCNIFCLSCHFKEW